MTVATTPRFSAEPNVTPMIDVLLVMLIVFMVAMMRVHHTMDVQLPQPCVVACGSGTQIVLEVLPGPRYRIDQTDVVAIDLLPRLKSIYAPRPEKVIQVAGSPGVRYNDVVAAMDVAKSAGVLVIAVSPRRAP
jgi:biopolymer transport protein TolR